MAAMKAAAKTQRERKGRVGALWTLPVAGDAIHHRASAERFWSMCAPSAFQTEADCRRGDDGDCGGGDEGGGGEVRPDRDRRIGAACTQNKDTRNES